MGKESGAPVGLTDRDEQVLGRVALLRGLDEKARYRVIRGAAVKRYPRGATLFIQGDPATVFFVILSGWVKLFRTTEDGAESVIAVLTRGESFAEAANFDQSVFPVSAVAIEDARLLVVPAQRFIDSLQENGDYAVAMLASMSRRLRGLVSQIEQLTVRSAAERLAAFLVNQSVADNGEALVHLPLEKALIAGRLGMQPETFSRALSKLRSVGVACDGNEIRIADVAMLRDYSNRRGR